MKTPCFHLFVVPENRSSSFPTTEWTLILGLRSPDIEKADIALDRLCQGYYRPLYTYARSGGLNPHDAEDAVQDFFAHVIGNESLKKLQEQKGSMRGWMKTSFTNRLNKRRAHQSAQKRGGRLQHLPLDFVLAEEHWSLHHSQDTDPAHACDLTEALLLWEGTQALLKADSRLQKRPEIFAALQAFILTGWHPHAPSQTEMGRRLGITANALKVRLNNLITKARNHFAAVARETLDPHIPDEEVEYLWQLVKTHGSRQVGDGAS